MGEVKTILKLASIGPHKYQTNREQTSSVGVKEFLYRMNRTLEWFPCECDGLGLAGPQALDKDDSWITRTKVRLCCLTLMSFKDRADVVF